MSRPWTYLPSTPGSALEADRAVLRPAGARDGGGARLVDAFVVPIRSGRAWPVRAGQLCRIVAIEGPQVADFNCWNLHNPRERFWAARTRQLDRAHVTDGDRLWSRLPYLRPMLTITNDTIQYGDRRGRRALPRPARHALRPLRHQAPHRARTFDFNCHSNLTRAVLPWRLTESDVHDVLNIFQVTGLDRTTATS